MVQSERGHEIGFLSLNLDHRISKRGDSVRCNTACLTFTYNNAEKVVFKWCAQFKMRVSAAAFNCTKHAQKTAHASPYFFDATLWHERKKLVLDF